MYFLGGEGGGVWCSSWGLDGDVLGVFFYWF